MSNWKGDQRNWEWWGKAETSLSRLTDTSLMVLNNHFIYLQWIGFMHARSNGFHSMLLNGWISNNSFAITCEFCSELLKLDYLIWNPSLATFPAACPVQINSEYLKYFKGFNLGYGWAIFVPRFQWYIKFWQCNWMWLRKATPWRAGVFSYPSFLQGQGQFQVEKEGRSTWKMICVLPRT